MNTRSSTQPTQSLKHVLLLLLATVFWGLTFPLMKIAVNYADPFPFIAVRFGIAFIVLIPFYFKKVLHKSLRFYLDSFLLGILLFVSMYFQVEGIKYTTAANSAFLTAFYVVLVPICAAVISKKRPAKGELLGLILALIGLSFVCNVLTFDSNTLIRFEMSPLNYGDFLTLISAVSFTIYILLSNNISIRHEPTSVNTLQMAFCSIGAYVAWGATENQRADFLPPAMIVTVVVCAVFSSAIAYLLMLSAQSHVSPTNVVLIFTAEPVLGAVFAMIIPNIDGTVEIMSATTIVGSILIVSGILASELFSRYTQALKKG